jgi:hypothetical protein
LRSIVGGHSQFFPSPMSALCRSVIVDSPLTYFVPWWHSQSWMSTRCGNFTAFFSLQKVASSI